MNWLSFELKIPLQLSMFWLQIKFIIEQIHIFLFCVWINACVFLLIFFYQFYFWLLDYFNLDWLLFMFSYKNLFSLALHVLRTVVSSEILIITNWEIVSRVYRLMWPFYLTFLINVNNWKLTNLYHSIKHLTIFAVIMRSEVSFLLEFLLRKHNCKWLFVWDRKKKLCFSCCYIPLIIHHTVLHFSSPKCVQQSPPPRAHIHHANLHWKPVSHFFV